MRSSLLLHILLLTGLLVIPAQPPSERDGPHLVLKGQIVSPRLLPDSGGSLDIGPVESVPTNGQLHGQIEEAIRAAEALSAEKQAEQLDSFGRQLTALSTSESIGEIGRLLGDAVGARPRVAPQLQDLPDAAFDPESAQIQDVVRAERPDGAWEYRLLLVDAQGLTRELEIDAQRGERLYGILQKIKANPLLEQVYRTMAMPLLDRLLRDRSSGAAVSDR